MQSEGDGDGQFAAGGGGNLGRKKRLKGTMENKLFRTMAAFLTICIGLILVAFYLFFQSEMKSDRNKELSNVSYLYAEKLNDIISGMESLCGVISNNYDLQKTARNKPPEEKRLYLQERCEVNGKLAMLAQSYTGIPYEIAVVLDDGRTFSYGQHSLIQRDGILDSEWHKEARNKNGILWRYSDDPLVFNSLMAPYLAAQAPIYNIRTNKVCGVIYVELSKEALNSLLGDMADKDYQICVLDGTEQLFAVNEDGASLAGKDYLVTDSLKNGWTLEMRLKYDRKLQLGIPVLLSFFLLLVILISAFVIIDFYCGRMIIRPITRLVEAMNRLQLDNLTEPICIETSLYEVKYLCEGYNQMLKRIQKLVHHVEQVQVEAQKAQYAVLQAQINPHFLYNTLDTIAWQIRLGEAEEAHRNLMDFSRYFRLSLGKGKQTVTLQDELEHTRIYMNLMSVRYLGQIQYSITSLTPDILNCLCPKLILQPIVENSINHGILQQESQSGIITVTAKKQGEDILIEVLDDGIGISTEGLEQIEHYLNNGKEVLKKPKEPMEHGYGIFNINRRLKLLYGKQYGLKVRSQYGKHTHVSILFPAIWEGKNAEADDRR